MIVSFFIPLGNIFFFYYIFQITTCLKYVVHYHWHFYSLTAEFLKQNRSKTVYFLIFATHRLLLAIAGYTVRWLMYRIHLLMYEMMYINVLELIFHSVLPISCKRFVTEINIYYEGFYEDLLWRLSIKHKGLKIGSFIMIKNNNR